MIFKYFIILGVSFLMSCGGGGSSNVDSSSTGTNTGQITDQLQIVE